MHTPYIGVTGFSAGEEITSALHIFEKKKMTSHRLMCGLLANSAIVRGEKPPSERYVTDLETLSQLITLASGRSFPVIHYRIWDCETSFSDDLVTMLEHLHRQRLPLAVQLNGTPAATEVQKIRTSFPEVILIHQIVPALMAKGVPTVIETVLSYGKDAFSYVLIDPSCGEGKIFSFEDVQPLYEAFRKAIPEVTVGFAGGFDVSNVSKRVHDIVDILGRKDFCIDAEGKLFAGDRLDMGKVETYLDAATEVLCSQ